MAHNDRECSREKSEKEGHDIHETSSEGKQEHCLSMAWCDHTYNTAVLTAGLMLDCIIMPHTVHVQILQWNQEDIFAIFSNSVF